MNKYVLSFSEINGSNLPEVGGKGANLGELAKIPGISIPEGFCVTTETYKKVIGQTLELDPLLEQLSLLQVSEREKIGQISTEIRRIIEGVEISRDIEKEIIEYITKYGEKRAYAVRSSATAEDLPVASFAGQQDSYLNIKGTHAILHHIRKCWASLFTERVVIYRMQNGFDHCKVYLSVVIQRMILPHSAGIMFTADPVTSNRKVLSIDASFGIGEALVSGLVNPDIYKVRDGEIINKKISTKKLAIYAVPEGGTREGAIDEAKQNSQTLTDEQILQLGFMGKKIEAYFGCPQDIEWCLSEESFFIVQSRPITTLYPIPENNGKNRVYFSMGHLQMMTEDIKPLGISFCQLLSFWFGQNLKPAGGRLFIDGTYDLSSTIGRKILLASAGKADILMENALLNVLKRKELIKSLPRGRGSINLGSGALSWVVEAIKVYRRNDSAIVNDVIAYNEQEIMEMEQTINRLSGDRVFEFIIQDTKNLKGTLTGPQNMSLMVVGGFVSDWVNKKLEKWLGVKNAVDIFTKSVPNNVTSQMGLALVDVSDVVRQYPAVLEYFNQANDGTFFEDLAQLEGGKEVSDSLLAFLEKYGMRCPGEIDITKPRWSEKPTALIPMILNNIKNLEPNASRMIFEQGRLEAEEKEREFLKRLEQLPSGKRKAKKTQKMLNVFRNVIGFREYPKYSFIKRFQIYKNALIKEASLLVEKGILLDKVDTYYLTFEEFRDVVCTNKLDYSIIVKRKAEYEVYEKLTPPRVMTSDGEIIAGQYNTGNFPQGALVGVAVSSGVIEGRARVVLKLEDAVLEEGDILVTAFTDPSWTPLFVAVRGLVTEVGGLMTHGAVITREYGIPGVVGVENATKLIKDGQMIRVNGTEGYVEIL